MLMRRTNALQDEADDLKAELDAEQRRRLALVREKAAGFSTQGIAAELEAEIRAREEVQDELDKMQQALTLILQKNSDLQVALAGCTCNGERKQQSKSRVLVSDSKTRADLAAGHEQMNNLMGQKNKAMEKVYIQKAQLQEVMLQNQVLGLALEEMQMEMKKLTLELRKHAPKTQDSDNSDLEAVLGKMERVARRGGGAYLRLNTDAKLREVAKDVKKQNEEQAVDDYHENAQNARNEPSPAPPRQAVSLTPRTPVVLPATSLSLPPAGGKHGDGLVLKSPTAALPPVQTSRSAKPSRPQVVTRQDSMRQGTRVVSSPSGLPSQGPSPNSARTLQKAKTLTHQSLTPQQGSMAIGSMGGFALVGGSASTGGGR